MSMWKYFKLIEISEIIQNATGGINEVCTVLILQNCYDKFYRITINS